MVTVWERYFSIDCFFIEVMPLTDAVWGYIDREHFLYAKSRNSLTNRSGRAMV